ncbi:MAG TPA: MarR family transcriptional regulator [Acidimicrobiales bacterium]|nr:MarR family transcriptional regulator [Acidimicrobiales bacterium]
MSSRPPRREPEDNTTYWMVQAASGLQRRITEGLVAAGHPVRTAHAAVFGNIDSEGTRLSTLAERANMTAQAMGELVDDLVAKGYLTREPDPTDRRAKLITITDLGYQGVQDAYDTISGIEDDLAVLLGRRGLVALRRALRRIADAQSGEDG